MSSDTFGALDDYMWRLAYKWAVYSHSNKSKSWVVTRYFGRFNKFRRDRWVFGDRKSGAYLLKFAWTRIVRHQLVRSGASPDDPGLAEYWAVRRRRAPLPPIDRTSLRLFKQQECHCALCGAWLLPADDRPQSPREWEHWLATTRKTLVTEHTVARADATDENEPRLVHIHCRRPHVAAAAKTRQLLHAPVSLQGLLEPDAVKAARPVLKGGGRRMRPAYLSTPDMTNDSGVKVACGG